MSSGALRSRDVVSVRVDATSYADACAQIGAWARGGESRYVCACNVHMVMEAYDDPSFRSVVNDADLVTPDGMPLVWALRAMGVGDATRVYGPDLMRELCTMAARESIQVGLYGGTPETLAALSQRLPLDFPGLTISYAHSPPFDMQNGGVEEIVRMRAAGVRVLFVGLGCPKQERWMARQRGSLPAVMVGVGAAFDFLARRKAEAPDVIQRLGLEWAFRLITEPRRLWRRYARHNPRFVVLIAKQLRSRGKSAVRG